MPYEINLAQLSLNMTNDIIVAISRKELVTEINRKGCEILGYPKEELINKNWFDNYVPVRSRNDIRLLFHQMLAGVAALEHYESPVLARDGSERIISWHNILLHDEAGNTMGTLNSGQDITERIKSETVLRESEEKYRDLADQLPEMVFEIDINGKVTFVNHTVLTAFGLSADDINRGIKIFDYIVPEQRGLARERFMRVLEQGEIGADEYTLQRKDGTTLPSLVHAVSIRRGGQTVGIRGIGIDLTKHKKAEKALREEKDKAQRYLQAANVIFVAIEANQHVSLINRKGCEVLGYQEKEIIGKNWFDFIPERLRGDVKAAFDKMMKRDIKPVEYFENPVLTKSGQERIIAWHNTLLADEAGNVIGTLSSGQDITERKKAEEALRESEEKYRDLFTNIPSGYAFCQIVTDKINQPVDFIYIEVNDAFERLTGLRKVDVVGKKVTEAIPGIKEQNPELIPTYGKVALTGETAAFELFFKPLDIWLAVSVYSPKRCYFVAVFENITERKRAEAEIAHLASFPELNPNPVLEVDAAGNLKYLNPAARRSFPDLEAQGKHHPLLAEWEAAVDALRGKKQGSLTREVMVADTWFWRLVSPVPNSADLRVYAIDITTRKKLEKELDQYRQRLEEAVAQRTAELSQTNQKLTQEINERRKTEEGLALKAAILDKAREAVFLVNPRGDFVYANEAATTTYGYSRDEFLDMNLRQLLRPQDAPEVEVRLKEVLQTGRLELDTIHVRQDKSQIAVQVRHSLLKTLHGSFIVSVMRDKTGQCAIQA